MEMEQKIYRTDGRTNGLKKKKWLHFEILVCWNEPSPAFFLPSNKKVKNPRQKGKK